MRHRVRARPRCSSGALLVAIATLLSGVILVAMAPLQRGASAHLPTLHDSKAVVNLAQAPRLVNLALCDPVTGERCEPTKSPTRTPTLYQPTNVRHRRRTPACCSPARLRSNLAQRRSHPALRSARSPPSLLLSLSQYPTAYPTRAPTAPTSFPTGYPTVAPTTPTSRPTRAPTAPTAVRPSLTRARRLARAPRPHISPPPSPPPPPSCSFQRRTRPARRRHRLVFQLHTRRRIRRHRRRTRPTCQLRRLRCVVA